MTTAEAPAMPREQADHWVSVARSLAPLISAEVIEGERNNNVTNKVVRALEDAGLYPGSSQSRLVVPKPISSRGSL